MTALMTVETMTSYALRTKGRASFTVGRTSIVAKYEGKGVVMLTLNGWPASQEAIREVLDVLQSGSSRRFG